MEPKRKPSKNQPADDVKTQGQPPDPSLKEAATRQRENERHEPDMPDKGKTESRDVGAQGQRNPKRGGA
jgi:hypothetical protein